MNIIIVGGGMVGENLVAQLNEEDNNITVIDQSPSIVNELTTRYDVMGVIGNGATHQIQQEAGIYNADLLIAVTGSDELNLLCCLIARKAGKCQTIARLRDPDYSTDAPYLKDELGLAMVINPEYVAAQEIARVLRFPSALKIETFADGRVELLKFRIPEGSALTGLSVKEVVTKLHCDILVCTIEREKEAYIANGDFVFKDKDIVSIIASPKNANAFFRKIKYKTNSVKNAIIVGGGDVSQYLCGIMQKSGVALKIIEKDPALCKELCSLYPNVNIINGDASDNEMLLEEGIATTDAFLALSQYDEENILYSLSAKNNTKCKLITMVTKSEFNELVTHLDLDTTINPKTVTSDMIVRYVRATSNTLGSNVETLYNFIPGKVEASEFKVGENSTITEIPLSKLVFKKNVLIASILRDNDVIIPRGHDVIKPGDAVIVVSELMPLHDISDILK